MSEQVKPVPEGFHTLTPAIVVREAAKAIEFYKTAFGAEEIARLDGPGGTVAHAELRIGNSMLMLSDECPEFGAQGPEAFGGSPVSLCLYVEDCDAVFNRAVEAGATVKKPLEDQFWGDRYGQVADPFGHTWSVLTHIKDVSADEMKQAMAAMSGGAGE